MQKERKVTVQVLIVANSQSEAVQEIERRILQQEPHPVRNSMRWDVEITSFAVADAKEGRG